MSGPQVLLPRAENDVSGSELERALLFARVSTMKMLRLQLAIERRDRAVALQAVDDLMDLDAWVARTGGEIGDAQLVEAMAREADTQRSALLQEKFGLAAGLVKRTDAAAPRTWADPEPVDEPDDVLGPAEWIAIEPAATGRRRLWPMIAAAGLVLALATIVALHMFGLVTAPDWLPGAGDLR